MFTWILCGTAKRQQALAESSAVYLEISSKDIVEVVTGENGRAQNSIRWLLPIGIDHRNDCHSRGALSSHRSIDNATRRPLWALVFSRACLRENTVPWDSMLSSAEVSRPPLRIFIELFTVSGKSGGLSSRRVVNTTANKGNGLDTQNKRRLFV